MKLKKQVKMILVGYLIVAIISYFALGRIEKLESVEDLESSNQKVVSLVR